MMVFQPSGEGLAIVYREGLAKWLSTDARVITEITKAESLDGAMQLSEVIKI